MKNLTLLALAATLLASCGGQNAPAPTAPGGTSAPKISGFVLSGSSKTLTVRVDVQAACVFSSNLGSLNMTQTTLEGSPFAYKVSLSGSYQNAKVVCTNTAGSGELKLGTVTVG